MLHRLPRTGAVRVRGRRRRTSGPKFSPSAALGPPTPRRAPALGRVTPGPAGAGDAALDGGGTAPDPPRGDPATHSLLLRARRGGGCRLRLTALPLRGTSPAGPCGAAVPGLTLLLRVTGALPFGPHGAWHGAFARLGGRASPTTPTTGDVEVLARRQDTSLGPYQRRRKGSRWLSVYSIQCTFS